MKMALRDSSVAFILRALKEVIRYNKIKYSKKFQDSQSMLQKYKDIHKGEKCYIVATGPSLTIRDLEKIKNEYTFGVNTCYKLFEKTTWRPDYYCVSDVNVYKEIRDDLKRTPLNQVFFEGAYMDYNKENGVPFYQFMFYEFCSMVTKNNLRKFSADVSKIIYGGPSVVYIVLQLAIYMGFSEIYLLGVDCNYTNSEKHCKLAGYVNQPKIAPDAEKNMIACFETANKMAAKIEVKIYNATRGGRLEVFERVDLDKISAFSVKKSR